MRKLFVWLALGAAMVAKAEVPTPPRLVVVVMVDELGAEQLFLWQKKFEKGGFARLLNQGMIYPNVMLNSTSLYEGTSVASFYTGATPSVHGVVSRQWFDRFSQRTIDVLQGYSQEPVSDSVVPYRNTSLLCSTLGDELRRVYPGKSQVRAIGLSPHIITWAKGNNPDGYYVLDSQTGMMRNGSKTHLPQWVHDFNGKGFADLYRQREWGPLNDINDYYASKFRNQGQSRNFLYKLNASPGYGHMVHSPYGNLMMRDFAVAMLLNENLGRDAYPDLLTVSFSLKPGVVRNAGQYDAEVEDMMLRLDREMTGLVGFLDEVLGLDKVLVVLTGAFNRSALPTDNIQADIPTGAFNGRKALSLLNLYFMAKHGQGKWVQAYHDGSFYLNEKLIADKKISMDEMRREAADLLIQMSGVARAYTYDQLMNESSALVGGVVYQSFHAKRSGDVLIELEPGWGEELDNGEVVPRPQLNRQVPVVFFGASVPHGIVHRPCNVVDVAPTISSFLQIAMPNGNVGSPMTEVFGR
ncbi:MAG: alkaline phosphatase family protein [Marinilabiliaceae bacterium]|nr:alkaline phosphatase family protein [Marinilabiliaceae bacterium]